MSETGEQKQQTKREIEVFGVTYDHYVMLQLHRILTQQLDLKTVVDEGFG